jgi:rRNA biogenesis protein RRP5
VKALVLKVEQRRISLSIKPSHFDEADFNDDSRSKSDDEQGQDQLGVVGGDDVDSDAASEPGENRADSDAMGEDNSSESDDDSAVDINTGNVQQLLGTVLAAPAPSAASMKISGFQWFGELQDAGDEPASELSSVESDGEEQPSKKRKKRKEIEHDLTADMHSKGPESNADFERLLLGSPNSSYLWIQYMSFQLQLSEVDKAREIARRAVEAISFREEQERLNVWIALLNLENVYGTDESLDKTFKEAARANDSKTVHLRLASIFDDSEKSEVRQSF